MRRKVGGYHELEQLTLNDYWGIDFHCLRLHTDNSCLVLWNGWEIDVACYEMALFRFEIKPCDVSASITVALFIVVYILYYDGLAWFCRPAAP